MSKKFYNIYEMENAFEIGRFVQNMIDNEEIYVEDRTEAFALGLQLAVEFEDKFPDTDEYNMDLEEFVLDKIVEKFGGDK